MDWLMDLLGLNNGKGTQEAAEQNRGIISGLDTNLNSIINQTDTAQQGHLGQALGSVDLGAGGEGILRDVLGLGGADGSARAMEAFQGSNPGYQFQMDQGLDALDRRAASRGMLSSGNTNLDTLNFSQGLADQSFGSWYDRLLGGVDRQSSALGDMASQAGQVGATRLGVTGDIGSLGMAANNQTAAGKEASQGAIWDLLGNVAGVAGSAFGLGGGGFGKGAGTAGLSGGSKAGARLGYGGGF
jgi:hypothetical protein